MLLRLENIIYNFGGQPLLNGANFTVYKGDRIAIAGRNGSGKSTFLQIASRLIEPSSGDIYQKPQSKFAYLHQAPDFSSYNTIRDYMELQLHFEDDLYQAQAYLDVLGLSFDDSFKKLSGGEKRRVALAGIFALKADILFLDEPTNHLDIDAIEWLENQIKMSSSAVVVISHDRRFLENMSRSVLWLDRGRTKLLGQNFSAFEAWRDQYLQEEQEAQHKLAQKIIREEHWLRYGVSARRKRNVRRLAELKTLKITHQTDQNVEGRALIKVGGVEKQSKLIIEAKHLFKSYGDRCLVKDFSLRIYQKDRFGLIGKNGIGKTTLLGLLTGQITPDQGHLKLANQLKIAYLDQQRSLNSKQSLKDYLTEGRGDTVMVYDQERHIYSYMKDFLFKEEQARMPIGELSGGERARLILARLFTKNSDLLVLDEPTNDLDMETLDVLEEMLLEYKGTVLLVSHDRDFLDRVVQFSLSPLEHDKGSGIWHLYAGGYSAMLEQQKAFLAQNPSKQKRKSSLKFVGEEKNEQKLNKNRIKKLSYHQKYALETLPKLLDQLVKEIKDLEILLETIDLASNQNDQIEKFHKITKCLEEKQLEKQKKEEEWFALELLCEKLKQEE